MQPTNNPKNKPKTYPRRVRHALFERPPATVRERLLHFQGDGPWFAHASKEVIYMKLNLKVLALIALAAALGTTGAFAQAPPQAPAAMQHSGMDMKNMKSQMEQIRAQMEQMQTLMKDTITKMAAADAAMKTHMETEQASMKSQMELQQAVVSQLQTMTDHMQTMHERMGMMPAPTDVHEKSVPSGSAR